MLTIVELAECIVTVVPIGWAPEELVRGEDLDRVIEPLTRFTTAGKCLMYILLCGGSTYARTVGSGPAADEAIGYTHYPISFHLGFLCTPIRPYSPQ